MTGWDAYVPRDGFCKQLVREVPVPPAVTFGVELTELELYTDGIRLVLTDHTPPPDGPEQPFTEWELRDDQGTRYQRRRGGVSRNLRDGPAHEHNVVFAPAAPPLARELELSDGERIIAYRLDNENRPS